MVIDIKETREGIFVNVPIYGNLNFAKGYPTSWNTELLLF